MTASERKLCPACSAANPLVAKFCLECGAAFPHSCPSCGASLPQQAKFCTDCGHGPLGAAVARGETAAPAPPAQSVLQAPSPRRPHTPKHIAERVLKARRNIEGERKSVTVLFVDIKGSTDLIEQRDPEEAQQILEPTIQAMVDAVHRFDGVVSKLMGDGLMALFGAPLALEDHAVRACYAAAMMQKAADQHSARLRTELGVEMQARVGLHSGEVVVLSVGTDLQMEYDAVGATVHLAARMEQIAPAGSIRLTAETARLVGGSMRLRDLGAVPIRGFTDSVRVFELLGVPAEDVAAERETYVAPMVGRETERLNLLERARQVGEYARASAVLVSGEAGIGKSRFCAEMAQALEADGWRILQTRAAPHEPSEPWLIAGRLLRGRFGSAADPGTLDRMAVMLAGAGLDAAAVGLLAVLGADIDDPVWQSLKPEQRRRRMLDSCRGWLIAESRAGPLCLVVDDLQWVDGESDTLLRELVDALADTHALLLLAARSEQAPAWAARGPLVQIPLRPLEAVASAALLDHLLPADAGMEHLKPQLVERAGGNPLFLGEMARSLTESARLADAGAVGRLPLTVQAIIAARVDDLQAEERELIEAAAVIGGVFGLSLLADVVGAPVDEVRAGVSRLQERGFIRERQIFPELEYAFQHPMAVEVIYRGLLRKARRALHAAALEGLLRRQAAGVPAALARLAMHAIGCESWETSVGLARAAAHEAMARSAHQAAAELYRSAIDCLARLPSERTRAVDGIDLRVELRHALLPLGRQADIDAALQEAKTIAQSIDDRARLGTVLAYQTAFHLSAGQSAAAIRTGTDALAIGEAIGDSVLVRDVLYYVIQAHIVRGDYAEAAPLCEAVISYPAVSPSEVTMVSLARLWLAWCLAEIGAFKLAEDRADAALTAARGAGDALPMLLAQLARGLVCLMQDRTAEAAAWLEAALVMSERPALQAWWAPVASPLGRARTLLGRIDEGTQLLEQAVAHSSTGGKSGHALRSVHLAEAYFAAGRVEDAHRTAAQAIEVARAKGERAHEAYALLLLAQLHHASQDKDAALELACSCEALARQLKMEPLLRRISDTKSTWELSGSAPQNA